MKLEIIKIDNSINKAYFKQNLKYKNVELFKENFSELLEKIDTKESEEHNKNIISDFLKDSYYKNKYEINTAGRKDLVIHTGRTNKTPVAVIIETKKPSNKSEMISLINPNAKALHETIHYYLKERIIKNNTEIKHIIISNIYEWFIFDATEFEKYFYQNKQFLNKYKEWSKGHLVGNSTEWFYNELAKPFIENNISILKCNYINFHNYTTILNNTDKKLINLYKIFSPEHLLKLPFANDYNKIDNKFYNELLYILGLQETKDGGKKLITRVKKTNREQGTILEDTINILKVRNKIENITRPDLYGETKDEQLFSIALELSITWLNRILFLKLLEGQLIRYNENNKKFAFIDTKKIKYFEELDELFFEVLAIKPENRTRAVNEKFGNLPYLNSSLFERTELEKQTLQISELKNRLTIPISRSTVLIKQQNNILTNEINTLKYLLDFLSAYNFSSDTKAEIQEDNRTIINSAVLGLIFEKINGYKDGAFYTPSFITTYISSQSIRKIVINKFNKANFCKVENFEDLKDKIDYTDKKERQKANDIINSIKICDPAVGSGHFLVSILNELVAVKSDLKILQDTEKNRIRGIKIQNINDELEIINEETSEPFQYQVNKKGKPASEDQNLQKALFYEKQNLIENCIFGVDINQKSVSICRLRLWIELLKNTFYTKESDYKFLETLPNIDINIKCGNSLINKFDTKLNIFERSAVNLLITDYKFIAEQYKKTTDYKEKNNFKKQIKRIKTELEKYAIPKDNYYKKYLKQNNELGKLLNLNSANQTITDKIVELSKEVAILRQKYEENYENVYVNSMEWAIEFPEILSETGKFVGFDLVLGNPPYFSISKQQILKEIKHNYKTYRQTGDIYMLFIERALQILKKDGILAYITSNKWMRAGYGNNLRKFLIENTKIEQLIDFDGLKVFDEASVDTNIIITSKRKDEDKKINAVRLDKTFNLEKDSIFDYYNKNKIIISDLGADSWNLMSDKEKKIKNKIIANGSLLKNWDIEIHYGIKTGLDKAFFIDQEQRNYLISKDPKSKKIIKPILRGRDVHKFFIDKKKRYLINTFNGKLIKNSITKERTRIDRVNIHNFPILSQYLKKFEKQLKKRNDQGEHWTNHRSCAYQNLFFQEKIIYPETTGRRSEFYLDTDNYLINKTCFMITGKNLKYLIAILSSKVVEFFLEREAQMIGKSAIQNSKIYIEKIPIPEKTQENNKLTKKIEILINKILSSKKKNNNIDTTEEQAKINQLVYKLYNLNDDEISLVEKG